MRPLHRVTNSACRLWLVSSPSPVPEQSATQNRRYKHVHGKFLIHPVDGRKMPIVLDAEAVDMTLGTGAVKVTLSVVSPIIGAMFVIH